MPAVSIAVEQLEQITASVLSGLQHRLRGQPGEEPKCVEQVGLPGAVLPEHHQKRWQVKGEIAEGLEPVHLNTSEHSCSSPWLP
jgi:hypothetical protein